MRSANEAVAERVASLVHDGPLSRFYEFQGVNVPSAAAEGMHAGCDVIRRMHLVRPLYAPEFNVNIPPSYFTIASFEADDSNDYLVLDRVLGNIQEPVDVTIRVEPTDISHEAWRHTEYLARLHSVNRGRDHDEELPDDIDYLATEEVRHRGLRSALYPLRYRDPLADDTLRSEQRFHETFLKAHVLFQIRVLAATPAVATLVGSVVAESMFTDGSYNLITYQKGEDLFEEAVRASSEARVVRLPIYETLWKEQEHELYKDLLRLASVAPADELCGAFRLPVASHSSPCCSRKKTDPKREDPKKLILLGHDLDPLTTKGKNGLGGLARGLHPDRVIKHMAVFGISGTGKTTSVFNILIQLAALGIPFMVLETAKTEYRALKALRKHRRKDVRRLAETLQVYTVGAEVSPLRHNPLEIQSGIFLYEHIENRLACFQAAQPMPGPLLALTAESLERVYDDHPDPEKPPVVADLIAAAEEVLAEKRYTGDTNTDLRAALDVRLGSLARGTTGSVFQCRRAIPTVAQLMESSSIIELEGPPIEQRCLLSLFLLTAIREHLKTVPKSDRSVRFVVVIEEAHNIVGRNTDARLSEDVADPRSHAAAYICRMLAELRSLGVAIIIVDQLPSSVAPEVTKNTASKLAFREVANNDREELGGTMLLRDADIEELARLETGEAFFSTEGYHHARRIQAINLHNEMDLASPPRDAELIEHLRKDTWFREVAEARVATELIQLREHLDVYDRERLRLTKRQAVLSAEYAELLAGVGRSHQRKRLADVEHAARSLRRELCAARRAFIRGPYRALLNTKPSCPISQDLKRLRDAHVHRFEAKIAPGMRSLSERTDRLIADCAKHTDSKELVR